ncbi:MAG: NifB/NifX family molybdenum-iron cluster-binding protein [candidate division WOR-3 bacterium]
MKVAVSTDSGLVSAHFGRCQEYTLAEVKDGKVSDKTVVPNPGHEPGFLPRFLAEKGVKAIICGGMGPRAQGLFAEQDIETWMGASGPVDAVLEAFAQGRLSRGESTCDHDSRGDGCSHHGH